jgi:CHAT domain-containing protein
LSETGLGKIASNTYQWDPHTTESGTIGLEYFFGEADDPILVVVVSGDGIQAHELANGRAIEQLVTAANKALAVGRVSELESQLVELAGQLLPPEVLTGLQNGSILRLVVSPDGALTQFPISALAIPGRSGQHYLLDRADVTMVPSLGWWFKERHGSPTWPANDALVVADPIVDEVNGCAVPVNLLADLRSSTQTFPRLSFTAQEAEAVTRYASRHTLLLSAERATEQMLLSSSPFNFKILHFATHAHAGDDLWSSFIVLRCRGELDALAGREIPSLKLNGQLVVLSACGGSAGRSLSGMGSDSIASGFLMGGASAVVASHWPVEDKSTAQLMEAFYQELENGTRVDHALRAAQLRLASSAPNSPRLWAAFEVIGDGDLVVPIEASLRVRGTTFSRRHWLVLLLTVVAPGGIAGAGLRKRGEGHGVKSN